MAEQAASGMTVRDFCEKRGIHITTFHGWKKQARKAKTARPKLAEVEVTAQAAPIELELLGGLRIGVWLNGESGELAKLIRDVLRYRPGAA
jgi:transposase-like protein